MLYRGAAAPSVPQPAIFHKRNLCDICLSATVQIEKLSISLSRGDMNIKLLQEEL